MDKKPVARSASKRQMQRAEQLLCALGYIYPVLTDAVPLRCGIHQDVIDRGGHDETPLVVKTAIHRHTQSPAYLQAIAHGGFRFDLDGRRCESIVIDHQRHAREQLLALGLQPPRPPAAPERRRKLTLSNANQRGQALA